MTRASGVVTAVNARGTGVPTVDVAALGGTLPGLRYPGWWSPRVGDAVVVDQLGQQFYVAEAFAGIDQATLAVTAYQTGTAYSSPHTGRSTAAPAVGSAGAIPFLCARSRMWSAMSVEVTGAAGAGGAVRLGVYSTVGGYPAALIGSPGAVPTTSTGLQSVSFNTTFRLEIGLHWLAFLIEGAVPTLRSVIGTVSGLGAMPALPGGSVTDGFYVQGVATGSMPATFPTGLTAQSSMPLVTITAGS